jgi:hypothetical protein
MRSWRPRRRASPVSRQMRLIETYTATGNPGRTYPLHHPINQIHSLPPCQGRLRGRQALIAAVCNWPDRKLHAPVEALPAMLHEATAQQLSLTVALGKLLAVKIDASRARRNVVHTSMVSSHKGQNHVRICIPVGRELASIASGHRGRNQDVSVTPTPGDTISAALTEDSSVSSGLRHGKSKSEVPQPPQRARAMNRLREIQSKNSVGRCVRPCRFPPRRRAGPLPD